MLLAELFTEDGIQGTRLTTKEMDFLLDLVKDEEMSQSELTSRVNDVVVDYTRNKNSLRLAAPRMYMMVHGALPLDMPADSSFFNRPIGTMKAYARSKGYDVETNIGTAKADAEDRARETAKKRTQDNATRTMVDFYNANKDIIDYDSVTADRSNVIAKLMKGEDPDVAFYHHFKESVYLDTVRTKLQEFKQKLSTLKEGKMTKDKFYEIGDLLNGAIKMYMAARRGLGITNKLKNPQERTQHRSRIMGNLNRLRASVRKIENSF